MSDKKRMWRFCCPFNNNIEMDLMFRIPISANQAFDEACSAFEWLKKNKKIKNMSRTKQKVSFHFEYTSLFRVIERYDDKFMRDSKRELDNFY